MDRDRDRRRDIPPEDQYGSGRGQSYRPGNVRERTPPRLDSYRARSPPRRSDYMDSYKADTYRAPRPRTRSPPRRDDYRRRSPSPPRYRDAVPRGGDSYRGRPRSPLPPRREDLPRDDLFRRDVVRDERDYRDARDYRDDRDRGYMGAAPVARSPLPRYRDRSNVPLKRVREPSPVSSRGRRTPPPPAKRERLASPPRTGRYDDYPPSRVVSPLRRRYSPDPRDRRPSPPRAPQAREYRPRSRSPFARNDRVDPRAVDDWRRPRSPGREPRHDYLREESAANSAATSRRSSPPIHPSRAALQQPEDRPRSSRASPRDPYDNREPYRAPDPEPRPMQTPTTRDRGYDDDRGYANTREALPPPREPRHADDIPTQRAPPTGPSAQRATSAMAPPTGPAATTPSGPRAAGAPPSGPRGAPAAPRGDFSGRGRGGFGSDFAPRGRGGFSASFRGGRGGAPGPGLGRGDATIARSESFNQESSFGARAPPSGPRNSFSQVPPPAFRQSSSGSGPAAFQRPPQRFENGDGVANIPTGPKAGRRPTEPAVAPAMAARVHPALADLPKIIEGGQKAEPLIDRSKLNKLEDEAEKLRKQIEDKETRKRKGLREWDRLSRDVDAAALRSELAEQALKQHNGEGESTAAF